MRIVEIGHKMNFQWLQRLFWMACVSNVSCGFGVYSFHNLFPKWHTLIEIILKMFVPWPQKLLLIVLLQVSCFPQVCMVINLAFERGWIPFWKSILKKNYPIDPDVYYLYIHAAMGLNIFAMHPVKTITLAFLKNM